MEEYIKIQASSEKEIYCNMLSRKKAVLFGPEKNKGTAGELAEIHQSFSLSLPLSLSIPCSPSSLVTLTLVSPHLSIPCSVPQSAIGYSTRRYQRTAETTNGHVCCLLRMVS